MHKHMLLTIGCLTLLFLAMDASGQLYAVRDLGATDGAQSRPFAINNLGQIAALNRTNGLYRAFLYERGTWTNLGTLGGAFSSAAAVGDGGEVVGVSSNAASQRRGFIWTPGGTNGVAGNPQMLEIGTFGGAGSEAAGVNNRGQATGYAETATPRAQAFIYTTGTLVNIGTLLATTLSLPWSYGQDINDNTNVVGFAYPDNFSYIRAFLYANGSVSNLGHLGGSNAVALAVNNSRQVAGYSADGSGLDRAFRWGDGTMQNLGTLGGAVSYGYAINNHGHVVGASSIDATFTNARAFIAFSNTMTDLNTLLDGTGTNWVLLEARGINDSGQIVGLGRRAASARMFLLNPVPAIASVIAQGTNVVVGFPSIQGAPYTVDTQSNLFGAGWSPGVNIVTGNGGIAWATNVANPSTQYRRVRLVSP